MLKTLTILVALLISLAFSQNYSLSLGADLYLPTLAEQTDCDAEIALGFGFPSHHIDIFKSPMFYGEVQGGLQSKCYLFRGVHGAESHRLLAEVFHMFLDQAYWHGIPNDVPGMFLVQSESNPNHLAFSFLNEEKWLGPYAGVAGFDLANDEGLLMYLWSYNVFY